MRKTLADCCARAHVMAPSTAEKNASAINTVAIRRPRRLRPRFEVPGSKFKVPAAARVVGTLNRPKPGTVNMKPRTEIAHSIVAFIGVSGLFEMERNRKLNCFDYHLSGRQANHRSCPPKRSSCN